MSSWPCFTPRGMTPSARKPSNIRGKIVTKSIRNGIEVVQSFGQRDDDPPRLEVDLRADVRRERHLERLAIRAFHFEEKASAALVDVDHDATLAPLGVDEREA